MKMINILKSSMTTVIMATAFLFIGCDDKYPDLEDGIYAEFITNKGTMVAELFYEQTPVTVANFIALAEGKHPMVKEEYKDKKYFNGIIFHRVIDQFMIQGGDPTATGSGDPGYKFPDEFNPELKHDKPGMLSMANSGPATNGSQFFITEVPTPNLDNRHTVFGELVMGLDVQDSISNVKTADRDKPVDDVVINELNIIRKGSAAKKFDAPKVFETELPKVEQRQEELRKEAIKKKEEEMLLREEKNVEAAKDFKPTLDDYTKNATTKDSGLRMFVINKGDGEKPAVGETAKLNYEGYFLDGRLFDSNVREVEVRHGKLNEMKDQRGGYQPMPTKISPDASMIPGFKEAISEMRVGDKVFFYIPSHLGYGDKPYGPNGEIPANTDLMFIIEMTELLK